MKTSTQTYLRGLNRSSIPEPELPFCFDSITNKVSRTYFCRYSKWRLVHSDGQLLHWACAVTSAFPYRQTALSMCRDLSTHARARAQRNHSPSLPRSHTKQAGGGGRDWDWVGDPWRGLPTGNCDALRPVYQPQHLPPPRTHPVHLMHIIIAVSHDCCNDSYWSPSVCLTPVVILTHKGTGGFPSHFHFAWTSIRCFTQQ